MGNVIEKSPLSSELLHLSIKHGSHRTHLTSFTSPLIAYAAQQPCQRDLRDPSPPSVTYMTRDLPS